MRFALRTLVLIASVAAISSIAIGATASSDRQATAASAVDSAEVAQAVNDYQKALSSGDSARALALLAPDAVILESGGVETRSEYRSHHLASDIAFAKAVASNRGPLHVTVAGNTAWTASTSTTQGTFNGRAINSLGAESMVLTKGANGWLIRAIHWSSRTRRPAS